MLYLEQMLGLDENNFHSWMVQLGSMNNCFSVDAAAGVHFPLHGVHCF